MNKVEIYRQRIKRVYPELPIEGGQFIGSGQFNDVIQINNDLVFRFPRSLHAAKVMVYEVAALEVLKSVLTTLPVPELLYVNLEHNAAEENFMSYRMLKGEPLDQDKLAEIADEDCLDALAAQIGCFLYELHNLPHDIFPISLLPADSRLEWQKTYQDVREQLFPHMREDACETIAQLCEAFLSEPANFAYTPTVRHGDFGGSNIIYDRTSQTISGIIDFSFIAVGDPAFDIASISTCGDAFTRRICKAYPEAEGMLERARFYRSIFPVLQALYGLRDRDEESFEDGIAQYR